MVYVSRGSRLAARAKAPEADNFGGLRDWIDYVSDAGGRKRSP